MTTLSIRFAPSLMAVAVVLLVVASMVACSHEDDTLVAPSGGNLHVHDLARGAEDVDHTEDQPGDLLPAEYRLCDLSTSEYTPNAETGTGKGEGVGLAHAQEVAVYDALKKDVYAQFTCATCDGTTDRCDQYVKSYDLAAAIMTNPARDCTFDRAKGKWVCEGEVHFQKDKGPGEPYIRAGCKKCD